jgi:hypothetical protein
MDEKPAKSVQKSPEVTRRSTRPLLPVLRRLIPLHLSTFWAVEDSTWLNEHAMQ